MKTFNRAIQLIFIICVMAYVFAGNVEAGVTIVIGQSNATGIVQNGQLGLLTKTGIVDCSHPGEMIQPFLKGGKFYSDCIKAVKGRTVDHIVFWQGESDTNFYDTSVLWKSRALSLLRNLHNDVANSKTKLVVVLLNSNPDPVFPYWLDIRQDQIELKGAYKVDSNNYPFEPVLTYNGVDFFGKIHLTTEGYKVISRDIAKILNK